MASPFYLEGLSFYIEYVFTKVVVSITVMFHVEHYTYKCKCFLNHTLYSKQIHSKSYLTIQIYKQ